MNGDSSTCYSCHEIAISNIASYVKALEDELDLLNSHQDLNIDNSSDCSDDNLDNEVDQAFVSNQLWNSITECTTSSKHTLIGENVLSAILACVETEENLSQKRKLSLSQSVTVNRALDFESLVEINGNAAADQYSFSLSTPRNDAEIDVRVSGDTSNWSSGELLTSSGIKAAYSGLYDTLQQSSNYSCILVQEFVVRPDVPLINLMNTIGLAAKSTQLVFSRRQRSQGIISSPQQNISVESDGNGNGNTPIKAEIEKDWDIVDVQVCISKELKKRVILCQFLRKQRIVTPNKVITSPRILRILEALRTTLNSAGLVPILFKISLFHHYIIIMLDLIN